ncbi:hypothetical protein [Endozoicomonas sp. ONNA2]|uniref:hypothetical protein n=1 Tax=Endozoicomonas sp. ONNA2 TaxID=2828741 RepID=UPI002147D5B5|nr:hypothetical protein [Endozoicomonas sp. ONNA2]
MNVIETNEFNFATRYNPSTVVTFSKESEAGLSGKKVSIDMCTNESPQIPGQNIRYDGRSLKTRKTEHVLATLSAIAMGSGFAIIIPAASQIGCFALSAAGMLLGGMTGEPEGQLIGAGIGGAIGYFTGFSVTACLAPYIVAKAYNFVLEASNGTDCERSTLADRVVAFYER